MKKHHKDYAVLEIDLGSDKSPSLIDDEGWLQCKFCGLALKSRFAYWYVTIAFILSGYTLTLCVLN